MSAPNTIVIAGGGLAGATAAFALREQGYAGRVVLVSEEATPPYGMAAVASSTRRWNALRARRRSSGHCRRVRRPSTYSSSSR